MRAPRRKRAAEELAAAQLPADRRPAGLRPGGAGAGFRRRRRKNIVTVQALGGTGGLKIGADFLRVMNPAAEVWISDPSWENHRQLFEGAGFTVKTYRYYDPKTHGLDFAGMQESLNAMPPGSIVVLHACCHNPTGVDLTNEQWRRCSRSSARAAWCRSSTSPTRASPTARCRRVRRAALRRRRCRPVFLSSSFSKSFSLYGERVGALSVVTGSPEEAAARAVPAEARGAHQLLQPADARRPDRRHRPCEPELRSLWDRELGAMRDRIKDMRKRLVEKIQPRAPAPTSASSSSSAACSPTPA